MCTHIYTCVLARVLVVVLVLVLIRVLIFVYLYLYLCTCTCTYTLPLLALGNEKIALRSAAAIVLQQGGGLVVGEIRVIRGAVARQ